MTARNRASTQTPDPTPDPPAEGLAATVPGFAPIPTPDPPADPATPATSTTEEDSPRHLLGDRASSSGRDNGGPTAGEKGSPDRTTSSPASTADPLAFVELARTVVGLASLLVRLWRQRRIPGLPPKAWLADDEDQAAIGDPLARIAARHTPLTGEGSSDVVDGLGVLVGTAGYTLKGLDVEAELAPPLPAPVAGDGAGEVVDGPRPAPPAPTAQWGPG